MTIPEFKKIGRLLIEAYKELDTEALKEGIDIFGEQYVVLKDKVREKVLAKFGFTLEEYRLAREEASTGDQNLKQALENLSDPLKGVKIPTFDEIRQIADEVAKQYVVPPVITNQIVKETIVKEPTIVKETKVEQITNHVLFDPAPIHDRVKALARRVDEIKVPEPINIEALKEDLKLDFGAMFQQNINILGMPDFRKLAMGLQGQIDELAKIAGTGGGGGSGTGSIIATTNTGDNQNYILARAATSSIFYVILNNGFYTTDDSSFGFSVSGTILTFTTALPSDLANTIIKLVCL